MAVLVIINICIYFCQAVKTDDVITVVVDAGHGGNDPGKVGVNGTKEKDINLSIALKLKDELEQKGIKVILTRSSDESLEVEGARNKKTSDMNRRMEIVNDSGADLLISIHQNSFTDASVQGAQTFYYNGSKESEELAVTVQGELVKALDENNKRKAKAGNDYYVLRKSMCPAIIVECGFLSNPKEEACLVEETYQQDIASAIAAGVYKWIKGR
ncbi:MAG: N-acetylmuramoyl-L-alanine amidase CwlD [Clostridium sp.]|nr:N-acetylmuramoyl-L-alanine amidase CwlD [Clostridium sp.]MCM1398603.1 N-acetylmuramoyl-L-alanine amidase CwlD [Clostridium sp.]MCM1459891.1 N-acetylmuramoyl-L-alanine amidase CwlD [Bacteroides sp.]